MVSIYRGTTKEFHDKMIDRYGVYTHRTSVFVDFLAAVTNFRFFSDTPFRHIHFSTLPSFAIEFALMRSSQYSATPILILADSEALERYGLRLYPLNSTTFLIHKGEIPPYLYRTINLGDADAYGLKSRLFEAEKDATLEEKILKEFLDGVEVP